MVFYPPACVPKLSFDPPDDVPIHNFLFDEQYGRHPFKASAPTFVDGLSGKSYTPQETQERIELLARALQKRWDWSIDTIPNKLQANSGQGDLKVDTSKVACVFTLNTVNIPLISSAQCNWGEEYISLAVVSRASDWHSSITSAFRFGLCSKHQE